MSLEVSAGSEENAHDDATMLEKLPSDVLVRVNEFLKLPDRIRLASSSKSLQKLVFQDCIPLWTEIDFSTLKYGVTKLVTDYMLSKLLIRVNAKDVARYLNVDGCTSLTGMGLHPLSGSETLERLVLQQKHASSTHDEDIFVPILRTMIPFRLAHVCFQDPYGESLSSMAPSVFTNFLCDLRAARLQDFREQQIKCFACRGQVADASLQLVSSCCGVPNSRCGTCHSNFCRHGSCSITMNDCVCCGDTSCDTCAKVKQCSECNDFTCQSCCPVYTCAACSDGFCRYCDEASYCIMSCFLCDKDICTGCRESEGMRFCEGCSQFYCGGCREVNYCELCDSCLCTNCAGFNFLDCCRSLVCTTCLIPQQCDQCHKKYCEIETVEKCDLCKKMLCEDCAEVNKCGTCSKKFCVYCRESNTLSCCGTTHCAWCVTPKVCTGCDEKICKKHANECGSCSKCLCNQCGSNRCDACFKPFCNDDCAFVDTCEQCEANYCQGCAVVLRCQWCGVSCCDKCRRRGGCCEMCIHNETPTKKARLSR